MKSVYLGTKMISSSSRPYIIAEVGVNHEGDLDRAYQLIKEAALAGADAVKFQTYKAEKLSIVESPAYWDLKEEPTTTQYNLFKKYDGFGEREYIKLKKCCDKHNVDFLSTPFDSEAVHFLNRLVPFFKVASADINNFPLLREVGATTKPVIISTGAATFDEISVAVEQLTRAGCSDVILMHCVLNYPTGYSSAALGAIKQLIELFPTQWVGYSDHTLPDKDMLTVTASAIMGARVIEKHFTDNKKNKGNDHYHSMDYADLCVLKSNLDRVWEISNDIDFSKRVGEEEAIKHARRSIVASVDITRGQTIEANMLACKRPGHGISPADWDNIIGKVAKTNISSDALLRWDDLV